MAFEAYPQNLGSILSNTVYKIPRNQRRYVWKETNWNDLFTDIKFVVDNHPLVDNHFLGSIVLQKEERISGLDQYIIIDGQQRIITVTLFLAAIMKRFKEEDMEELYNGSKMYLISADNKSQLHHTIFSEYHLAINKIIDSVCDDKSVIKTPEEIVSNSIMNKKTDKIIGDCFLSFHKKLSSFDVNMLESIRSALIDTNIIQIIAHSQEDSYTIFEILNARGQTLEDSELVKNYIMRYFQPRDNVDTVKCLWDQMETQLGSSMKKFFKHYATHKYGKVPMSKIFIVIREHNNQTLVSDLLDDIIRKANYYEQLLKPNKDSDEDHNCNAVEYDIYMFFKRHKAEQLRPVLLSLIDGKENHCISEKIFDKALTYIYRFFVCYNVIGNLKSNKIQDVIDKYSPLLSKDCSIDNIKLMIESLKKKLPTYQMFENAFMNVGYSRHSEFKNDQQSREQVQTTLELIENYYNGGHLVGEFTLEHILPDSETDKAYIIGNIIPLELNINNNAGANDLSSKVQMYKRSGFMTTQTFVRNYEGKTIFDVEKRTHRLAKLVYDDILKLDDFRI